MKVSVQLYEHETVLVGKPLPTRGGHARALTQADHDALARYNDAFDGKFFRIGHRKLTTNQFVGYLEVGDLAIEILPKADRQPSHDGTLWREGLLEMLRAALGLRLESPSRASQSAGRSPLLHIIAARFCEELTKLLHAGLAKAYRAEESNGATFRGKLMLAANLRENLLRPDRFYVRHTVYDRDTLPNRILSEALDVLRESRLADGLAAQVAHLRSVFPELTPARVDGSTFDGLHLGRTTLRYGDALTLARMILEQRAPLLRKGTSPVFALLFDMNVLWERYVALQFRKVAGSRLHVSAQESASLWGAPGQKPRQVRPDIVVRRSPRGEVLLIADTKWKVAPTGMPSDDDLKQMFVYNELFAGPRALLLYPSTGPATALSATFAGRAHSCETVQLGVGQQRWNSAAIAEQIRALLTSLPAD